MTVDKKSYKIKYIINNNNSLYRKEMSRSTVNSAFFMTTPEKPVETKPKDGFLIKGHESSESYEHIGGDHDTFIVNGPNSPYKLNRNTLRDSLLQLKKYSHTFIDQLTEDQTNAFNSVVESCRLLYGTPAMYDIILTDINAIFADIKNVKPATVGAFFTGCFTDSQFPGSPGCSR